jgi:hypothetical protein
MPKEPAFFNYYINGHNKEGFFPILAYLRFINLYALQINDIENKSSSPLYIYHYFDNSIKEFFKQIITYVYSTASKQLGRDNSAQLKLIQACINLLSDLIDKCHKEYVTITWIIELILKVIVSYNKQFEEIITKDLNYIDVLHLLFTIKSE